MILTEYDKEYFEIFKKGYKYDDRYPPQRIVAEVVANLFNPKTVLDVGCAYGYLVKALQELGISAYGIDISKYAIKKAITGTLCVGDATSLPFRNETFDVVIALDLVEHLKDPAKFVYEAYRVLKLHGYLIVKTCSPNSKNATADPTHVSVLHKNEWIKMFASLNFTREVELERIFRRKVASRLASYYTTVKPSSFIGKVLSKIRLKKHAILLYYLLIQPRYTYWFVLRKVVI